VGGGLQEARSRIASAALLGSWERERLSDIGSSWETRAFESLHDKRKGRYWR
jgi:hypothetical protein